MFPSYIVVSKLISMFLNNYWCFQVRNYVCNVSKLCFQGYYCRKDPKNDPLSEKFVDSCSKEPSEIVRRPHCYEWTIYLVQDTLVRTFSFNHIGSLIHFKRIFCFINWIVKKNNRLKNFLKRDSSIQPSATGIKFLQKLFPQLDNFISPKIKSYVVFSWSYVIFIGQSTKMSENLIENVRKRVRKCQKIRVMSTYQNISESFIIFRIWNFYRTYVIFCEVMSFSMK